VSERGRERGRERETGREREREREGGRERESLGNGAGRVALAVGLPPATPTRCLIPDAAIQIGSQIMPHWFLQRSSMSTTQSPTETPATICSCSSSRIPE